MDGGKIKITSRFTVKNLGQKRTLFKSLYPKRVPQADGSPGHPKELECQQVGLTDNRNRLCKRLPRSQNGRSSPLDEPLQGSSQFLLLEPLSQTDDKKQFKPRLLVTQPQAIRLILSPIPAVPSIVSGTGYRRLEKIPFLLRFHVIGFRHPKPESASRW